MTTVRRIFKTKASIIAAGMLQAVPPTPRVKEQKSPFRMLSFDFWKAFLITMRPYLIFVSGAAGLVGLAFIESPHPARIILAFFPLFISYGLGQALTDCFQTDTDAISSPYRPLVQGTLSKKQVLIVSISGLMIGILILAYLNPLILVLGIAAVLGLLGYTFFKKRWWAGPFWNSWIVALLPVIGGMTAKERYFVYGSPTADYAFLTFIFAVAAILFGYGNFVVMGYLKDVTADRETGYRTFPVVFGWKATAIYSDILAVAAAIFSGLALYKANPHIFGIAVFLIALAVNSYAQIKIHLTRDEDKAHAPIANVVRAFILYALAVVVTLKPDWLGFMLVFYLLFETTLRYRPEKTQV
jgi:4-hydroxybenzoate polyprenyltransferase